MENTENNKLDTEIFAVTEDNVSFKEKYHSEKQLEIWEFKDRIKRRDKLATLLYWKNTYRLTLKEAQTFVSGLSDLMVDVLYNMAQYNHYIELRNDSLELTVHSLNDRLNDLKDAIDVNKKMYKTYGECGTCDECKSPEYPCDPCDRRNY